MLKNSCMNGTQPKPILGIAARLILPLALITAVPCYAVGGKDGGGSDDAKMDSGSAWFLGNAPIYYCIEASSDFYEPSVAPTEAITRARPVVVNVIKTWKDYVSSRRTPDKNPEMRLNLNFVENCNEPRALTIFLGVNNPVIESEKKIYDNPVGFSKRVGSPLETGMARGFIWIRPTLQSTLDWNWPNALNGILLHEFGHVLGNEHVEGTIMGRDMKDKIWSIVSYIPEERRMAPQRLTQIDDEKQLTMESTFSVEGAVGQGEYNATAEEVFLRFVGRKPIGKIKTRLVAHGETDADFSIEYALIDEQSTNLFPLKFPEWERESRGDFHSKDPLYPMVSRDSAIIFRAARKTEPTHPNSSLAYTYTWRHAHSEVQLGTIKARNGTVYHIVFARNMQNGPFELRYFLDDVVRPLFVIPREKY